MEDDDEEDDDEEWDGRDVSGTEPVFVVELSVVEVVFVFPSISVFDGIVIGADIIYKIIYIPKDR